MQITSYDTHIYIYTYIIYNINWIVSFVFVKALLLSSLDVTLGYGSTFFGSYMVIGIISFIK